MERDEALAALREVAVEVLSVEPDAVTEDARFKEDLDADSLDLVELVMGLEERFDISVPEEDLEGVATVGQAVDLVMAKVGCEGMSDALLDSSRAAAGRRHRHGRQDARPAPTSSRSGRRCCAGQSMAAARSSGSTRPTLPVRFACEVRDFDPDAVLRPEGGAPPGPRHPARLRRRRRRARATPASSAPTPSRCAVIAATGVGGLITLEENCHIFFERGPVARQPVLRADDDAERHRRRDLDAASA